MLLKPSDASDIMIDFLEAAIHLVLCQRGVYPEELFERRQKYSVPVRQSRHPELNGYIQDMLYAIKPDLENGRLSSLLLVILDPSRKTIYEMFSFQFKKMNNSSNSPGWTLSDVEDYLRAFCRKISVSDTYLRPNPPDCTFALYVEMDGPDPTPTSLTKANAVPWIRASWSELEPHLMDTFQDSDLNKMSSPKQVDSGSGLIPIAHVDMGLFRLHMSVEEMISKPNSQRMYTLPDSDI